MKEKEREGERECERESRGIIHSLCAQSAVEITQGNEPAETGERQEVGCPHMHMDTTNNNTNNEMYPLINSPRNVSFSLELQE